MKSKPRRNFATQPPLTPNIAQHNRDMWTQVNGMQRLLDGVRRSCAERDTYLAELHKELAELRKALIPILTAGPR